MKLIVVHEPSRRPRGQCWEKETAAVTARSTRHKSLKATLDTAPTGCVGVQGRSLGMHGTVLEGGQGRTLGVESLIRPWVPAGLPVPSAKEPSGEKERGRPQKSFSR